MAKNRYSYISTSQLAKIVGVSQGTVDRAINGRKGISDATKARVLTAARTYGYFPDRDGSVIPAKGHRSLLYGVVLFDLNNEYFSRFTMDFERLCQSVGYNSILMFSHNDRQTEIDCLNQLVHLGVDGIVLCSVGAGDEYSAYVRSLPVPVVTIGNRLPDIPHVGIDDRAAMKDLTEYALRRGYRELLYYAPVLKKRQDTKENLYAQEERYAGFQEVSAENGTVTHTVTDAETLLSLLPPDPCRCAILCPTDLYALRVRSLLRDAGREDIGVAGFDGCTLFENCGFPTDTVSYDREALTAGVYRLLNDPDETLPPIPHRLCIQGSL